MSNADSLVVTVTILPGQDTSAEPTSPPSHRGNGPSHRTALLAAASVLAAGVLGVGAWKLLGSDDAATPVASTGAHTVSTHHDAAPRIPAHGPVSTKTLRAAVLPAFAAMSTSLGDWIAVGGRVHPAKHSSNNPIDAKMNHCAGSSAGGQNMPGLTSAKYSYGTNHTVTGEVSVARSAGAVQHDLARLTSARTVACLKGLLPTMLRHEKLGRYVTGSSVALHRLHGLRNAFRMTIVADYVVAGREIPVQVDVVGAALGRLELSMTTVSHDTTFAPPREVAALRAMVASMRGALR